MSLNNVHSHEDILPLNKINPTISEYEYLIPPVDISFPGGGGEFDKIDNDFIKDFIKYGELHPNDRVLDVGCGVGRIAIPLTQYLSNRGEYFGFDIVKHRIEWLQNAYRVKHPNFHFQLADVYNKTYNRNGNFQPSEYIFPYEDSSFDFVFLTSIFTHMLAKDVKHYLAEIARVLKPGKKCFITFFLLNIESLTNMACFEKIRPNFRFKINAGLTASKSVPEVAVAYHESFVRRIYKEAKLQISEPIHYGSWCKRKNFLRRQDVIVAEKL